MPLETPRSSTRASGGQSPCDTSGTATYGGYAEHAYNFDVATRLRKILVARAPG